jgi:hypothetical protein
VLITKISILSGYQWQGDRKLEFSRYGVSIGKDKIVLWTDGGDGSTIK